MCDNCPPLKSEQLYLQELYNLKQIFDMTDNCRSIDLLLELMDTEYYGKMGPYGFENEKEVDRAIEYMNAGKPDPDKEARTIRAEKWMADFHAYIKTGKLPLVPWAQRLLTFGQQIKGLWADKSQDAQDKEIDKDFDKG